MSSVLKWLWASTLIQVLLNFSLCIRSQLYNLQTKLIWQLTLMSSSTPSLSFTKQLHYTWQNKESLWHPHLKCLQPKTFYSLHLSISFTIYLFSLYLQLYDHISPSLSYNLTSRLSSIHLSNNFFTPHSFLPLFLSALLNPKTQ